MSQNSDLPDGVTREQMDVDILIIGGGAAGLSCAFHLSKQIEKHNQEISSGQRSGNPIPDVMIAVLEKVLK